MKYLKKRLLVLFFLLCIAVFFGLIKGSVQIPLVDILLKENQPIVNMRLLRILAAILVGSGLVLERLGHCKLALVRSSRR